MFLNCTILLLFFQNSNVLLFLFFFFFLKRYVSTRIDKYVVPFGILCAVQTASFDWWSFSIQSIQSSRCACLYWIRFRTKFWSTMNRFAIPRRLSTIISFCIFHVLLLDAINRETVGITFSIWTLRAIIRTGINAWNVIFYPIYLQLRWGVLFRFITFFIRNFFFFSNLIIKLVGRVYRRPIRIVYYDNHIFYCFFLNSINATTNTHIFRTHRRLRRRDSSHAMMNHLPTTLNLRFRRFKRTNRVALGGL